MFEFGTGNLFSAVLVGFIGLVLFTTSRFDYVGVRLFQVAAFAVSGFYVVWISEPYYMFGMALVIYSMFLALQYSFFERRPVEKGAGSVLVFIGVNIASTVSGGRADLLASLAGAAFVLFFLLLIWIASHEKLMEHVSKAKELETEMRKASVFVRCGMNVSELVHNMRNKLTVLYGLNDVLKNKVDSTDIEAVLDRQKAAYDRMSGTIGRGRQTRSRARVRGEDPRDPTG